MNSFLYYSTTQYSTVESIEMRRPFRCSAKMVVECNISHWIPAGSIKNISLRKCEKAHNGLAGENESLKDGLQRDCKRESFCSGYSPNRNTDTIQWLVVRSFVRFGWTMHPFNWSIRREKERKRRWENQQRETESQYNPWLIHVNSLNSLQMGKPIRIHITQRRQCAHLLPKRERENERERVKGRKSVQHFNRQMKLDETEAKLANGKIIAKRLWCEPHEYQIEKRWYGTWVCHLWKYNMMKTPATIGIYHGKLLIKRHRMYLFCSEKPFKKGPSSPIRYVNAHVKWHLRAKLKHLTTWKWRIRTHWTWLSDVVGVERMRKCVCVCVFGTSEKERNKEKSTHSM